MASYLTLTEGCSSAATASARILVAISFGVFACTNNPHQGDTSNPGLSQLGAVEIVRARDARPSTEAGSSVPTGKEE